MKLKRYVLLENNKLYDIQKPSEYMLKIDDLDRVTATSDDIFDLVRVGDLITIIDENKKEIVTQITNTVFKMSLLKTEYECIAIYKKQGKDFKCVWEREE